MLVHQRVAKLVNISPISLGFFWVSYIELVFMGIINQLTSLGGHHIVWGAGDDSSQRSLSEFGWKKHRKKHRKNQWKPNVLRFFELNIGKINGRTWKIPRKI